MESTLIRAFVLMLALTGFGANSVSSKGAPISRNTVHANSDTGDGGGGVGVTPAPMCLPSDPSHCGME